MRVEVTCKICGHTWKTLSEKMPKQCANRPCKTPMWQRGDRKVTHGHVRNGKASPTYISWRAMLDRCYCKTAEKYGVYGLIGVSVCEQWRSFTGFLADMGARPAGKTLDRFPDKGGNYEPGNCRWATWKEQAANRRNAKAPRRVFETPRYYQARLPLG